MPGRVGRDDVSVLCAQVRERLSGGSSVVVCDVQDLAQVDVATIDALARMQLTARRLGGEVRLRAAPGQLLELIRLVGLAKVLPLHPGLFHRGWHGAVGWKPRW